MKKEKKLFDECLAGGFLNEGDKDVGTEKQEKEGIPVPGIEKEAADSGATPVKHVQTKETSPCKAPAATSVSDLNSNAELLEAVPKPVLDQVQAAFIDDLKNDAEKLRKCK